MSDTADDKVYKKRINAWAMYDWANSAFATTVLAAVLPVYYSQVAGATLSSAAKATQYWSATLSLSVFLIALISPILGTVSDVMRGKKKFLTIFVGIGVVGTGLLVLISTGDWLLASVFFVIGRIGFGAANVFYDSLLPHIAKDEDQDWVSTWGYALGYLGGGILLLINVIMIEKVPDNFLVAEYAGIRLSFLAVAVWWALFSIPILRQVPEPESAAEKLKPGQSLVRVSFKRIKKTLTEIREYNELFKYLVSFLIYNDGIGIIISVAAIYVAELGFGGTETILAILLVQFVGIPYSIVFGNIPNKSHKRQKFFVAFVLFNIIALPLSGILGSFFLPKDITGTPSPDFAATASAVGQGEHLVESGSIITAGQWSQQVVAASLVGEKCSLLNFGCQESDLDKIYAVSNDPGDSFSIKFNGQTAAFTYSTGPDHGIWAVLLDGQPYLDEEGNPVMINAYRPQLRYEESRSYIAETEGEHTLTIVSTDEKDPASSGNALSVARVEVLPPVRTSSLTTILALIVGVQVIAAAFAQFGGAKLFSKFADNLDTRKSIMIALAAYAIIAVWGYFLNSVVEFWFLAWMVGVVQGGSQALSRSLYASMTPTAMSGEFFGFFSIMSKFASFLSPLVFVLSVAIFNSSRPGVLSLIVFFLLGMYLLSKVDVEEGKRVAKEKDRELLGHA